MGIVHKNVFWRDWMQMDLSCDDERQGNEFHIHEDWEDKVERKIAQKKAKAICKGCPALKPCLSYAIETNTRFGVFGGMNFHERTAHAANKR